MNARRPTSAPPELPGFRYLELLGSGGFADVFLYQQTSPFRRVAVKVLLPDLLGTSTVESFAHEANLMALVAEHPSIVSIHQAGVAADGRPFIVMEYCSKPNLQVRHRKEAISQAETLRIGVQIAGAVETAHRVGILHRDIKPANILVTSYNVPVLTDFGIATAPSSDVESVGMSVPWSPPEVFGPAPISTTASDVYSLAATLFTLLTNRTPFEVFGQSNSNADLIRRIRTTRAPATGRPDLAPAFEEVLARGLDPDPTRRFGTALEFARALQSVQISLDFPTTTVEIMDDSADTDDFEEDVDDDEGPTRIRGIATILAQEPAAPTVATDPIASPGGFVPPGGFDTTVDETLRRAAAPAAFTLPAAPSVETTLRRPPVESPTPAVPAARRSRRVPVLVGSVAAVLVVGGIVAASTLVGKPSASPSTAAAGSAPVDANTLAVPDIATVSGRISGTKAVFTWTNPDAESGDSFLWRLADSGATLASVDATTITVPAAATGTTCIEVILRRADGTASADATRGCAG